MTFQPEIVNDELWHHIEDLVVKHQPAHIIEIGSGDGHGSTSAFMSGMAKVQKRIALTCFEIDEERFAELTRTTNRMRKQVYCERKSTIPRAFYMSDEEIERMMTDPDIDINTKQYPLEMVLGWKREEFEKTPNCFGLCDYAGVADMVLIDGSAFTGDAELLLMWDASVVILDDTKDIKNWNNYWRLKQSPAHHVVADNQQLRNGYAIFERNTI